MSSNPGKEIKKTRGNGSVDQVVKSDDPMFTCKWYNNNAVLCILYQQNVEQDKKDFLVTLIFGSPLKKRIYIQ